MKVLLTLIEMILVIIIIGILNLKIIKRIITDLNKKKKKWRKIDYNLRENVQDEINKLIDVYKSLCSNVEEERKKEKIKYIIKVVFLVIFIAIICIMNFKFVIGDGVFNKTQDLLLIIMMVVIAFIPTAIVDNSYKKK